VEVDLALEQTPTPEHYADWTFDELPATLPTLAILAEEQGPHVPAAEGEEGPVPGLVTSGAGFADSPDAEVIAGGLHSKGADYVAIGRQGHVLMWGFAGTPDEMTDAGRAVFLNALAYVTRFRGEPILTHRVAESRDAVGETLALVDDAEPERRAEMLRYRFGDAPAGLTLGRSARQQWFDAMRPYLWQPDPAGPFAVDVDAQALGVANDDPNLLRRCVEDMEAGRHVTRATALLERYTRLRHADASGWRAWLDGHGDDLFFSDVGGYRFRSRRGDARPHAKGSGPRTSADVVDVRLDAWSRAGDTHGRLALRIEPGWHVYAPNAREPAVTKLRVEPASGASFVEPPTLPPPARGHASGHFTIPLRPEVAGDELTLALSYQACTETYCLPPVSGESVTARVKRY
jgi:hypothetical protein